METDFREENKIEINPSWVIQTIVAILLTVIGVMAKHQFEVMHNQIELQSIQIAQLRQDFVALEIGLRGDRFTRTQFEGEKAQLIASIAKLEERIRELEQTR